MDLRTQFRSIDVERLILVPIMTLLLIATVGALFLGGSGQSGLGLASGLMLAYRCLMAVFYLMAVILLLRRSDASARANGALPRAAAYAGTFLPFLLPFAGGQEAVPGAAVVAIALMVGGMVFSVVSLGVLGRSFGVEAQVRTLVQRGPYRCVRHPLYVGETIALIGSVLFAPTALKWVILLCVAGLQVFRAVQEERLLASNIPEYAQYMSETKRFLPGVF